MSPKDKQSALKAIHRAAGETKKRGIGRLNGRAATRQPDFGMWFHRAQASRICYEVRGGSNMLHDISYLASYIHDARIAPASVDLRKGRLRIGMRRDRWELFRHLGELSSVSADLVISPALRVEWRFQDDVLKRVLASGDDGLWIAECRLGDWPGQPGENRRCLQLDGAAGYWSLFVAIPLRGCVISLRDAS